MMRLFHGTTSTFTTPRISKREGVFWTATTSAAAQSYIPKVPMRILLSRVPDYLVHRPVWPRRYDIHYSIAAAHMDKPAVNVEWGQDGHAAHYRLPEGYPTYREVEDYLASALGYDLGTGRAEVRVVQEHAIHQGCFLINHAEAPECSVLVILEGAQDLRIAEWAEPANKRPRTNRHIEQFHRLESEGWDAVSLKEFTRSPTWGWVEHDSVGIFEHALPKLRVQVIPAAPFDWPPYSSAIDDVTETPEYLAWRARVEQDRLLGVQAKLRAGEAVVVSEADFNRMVDRGLLDVDCVSIWNPNRVGILDALLVGRKSAPAIQEALLRRESKRARAA